MDEQEYLGDAAVMDFTSFLRGLTLDGYAGLALRVGCGRHRQPVATLREAVEAYNWRGESFTTVNIKAEAMRREMQAALDQCASSDGRAERRLAELELLFVSTKTLSWGGVYEGAFGFLLHQAETGVLSQNLRKAAAVIDGPREDVCAFDDAPFRSDCGMTKVYAAMNQRTVVYEERLGAALGLLCRRFLERNRSTSVPDLLAFMSGDRGDLRRNPSTNGFVFGDKQSGREHARWNIRANWILGRLAADEGVAAVLGGHHRDRLRRIEAALFMIGEDVQDQPRVVASPPARAPRRVAERASPIREPGGSS